MAMIVRPNEKLVRKYSVALDDIQLDYRLSISAALGFFQDTAASFFSDRNLAAFDVKKQGVLWVMSDQIIRVVGDFPMWKDEITVEVTLSEITPVRFIYDFKLYDRDNACFADGFGTWNPVVIADGKPCSVDHVCEVAYESADGSPMASHKRIRIPLSGNVVRKESVLLGLGDMDFNRHISNRCYISHALEISPISLDSGFEVQEIEAKFLRQTYPGDTLTIEIHAAEEENAILVTETNSAGDEVCRMIVRYCRQEGEKMDICKHVIRGTNHE